MATQLGVQAARGVVAAFRLVLKTDRSLYDDIGRKIAIPTFGEETIQLICEAAAAMFEGSPLVIEVNAPYYIIGDIHGNIQDLLRILIYAGPPPSARLLFLGDYVDRGEYSVDVMTLLLAYYVMYPDSIVLIRGNHEFEHVNASYGFQAEVVSQFKSTHLWTKFNSVFMWMPLVAVVSGSVLCVHGGISPMVHSLHDIKKLHAPLLHCDGEPISDLVWSDPTIECDTYVRSSRGLGVQFGATALEEFLTETGMSRMIRAHQCVQAGIAKFGNDRLYTVFSCSSYEGGSNHCGIMFLDHSLSIQCFSLPPIEPLPRESALLREVPHAEILKAAIETDPFSIKLLDLRQASAMAVRGAGSTGSLPSIRATSSLKVMPKRKSAMQTCPALCSTPLKRPVMLRPLSRARADGPAQVEPSALCELEFVESH
jgi:protein phosphatase